MTIVEMGLDLIGVSSALNLERALELLLDRAAVRDAHPAQPAEAELPAFRATPSLD